MPVGTNGCPQGSWQPGQRHFCQALSAKAGGTHGQPATSRIPFATGGAERRAAPVPAPSDRGTAWMPQVATPREELQNPATR